MTFLDALVEKNIIARSDIPSIQKEMSTTGSSLEEVLIKHGVQEADIMKIKGDMLQVPVKTVSTKDVPFNVLEYIPEESAAHYKFVPLGVKDGVLEVGMVDPDNIETRDALNFISSKINLPYKIFLISEEDFQKVLGIYKGMSAQVTASLGDLETELKADVAAAAADQKAVMTSRPDSATGSELSSEEEEIEKVKPDTTIVEDAPVTKIVATILRYATEGKASDIHIEHMRDNVRVRFRVDGILNTSLVLPAKIHSALVARIKILSNMRLDEKRKPQDGRFSAKIEGRKIDFRVSTFPTYFGEKVVMRILDQEKGVKPLEEMGLSKDHIAMVKAAINKPYGLILISGPTGSGKTTTLYSMLNLVDKEQKNVLSLEDPVEYNMDGINQSQVRPEIGYTFATGLRTTLRQDPNVIMVGEIRDKETAQLAIQAALTGHLVLSTIHTNNSIGVIPRLVDMGVDPYLIAPTLVLAMAQRLAATLCPNGGKDVPLDGSLKIIVDKQFADLPEKFRKDIVIPKKVKEIVATADCPTGTRGRVAVFEMFVMDKDIEKAILHNPTETEIGKIVREKGMLFLKEDAMIKAFRGEIPFEEVNKF